MSDPKAQTQNEPTMEEILASIRRIISENDEEQEAKKRAETQTAAPPPPVTPFRDVTQPAGTSTGAPTGADVLELTEMVTEDGSVVSLTGDDGPVEEDPFRAIAPEPLTPEPVTPEPTMPEPVILAEIVEERVAEEGTGEKIEPKDENAGKAGMTMANPKDDSVEFASNSGANAATDERLVSDNAAAAATATFAELARTMAQEPSSSGNMPLGSGRTLEDLVKEMLRPMLKDWLDHNLPPMVEHMVRRELDRMTRKAEGI
jgi:cell pole-organizing protein PopZ